MRCSLSTRPRAVFWGPCSGPIRARFCSELAASHPGETLRLDIGATHVTVFQDARSAAHILRDHPGTYAKNFGSFSAYFGQSRLTSDGDMWRTLHKLSQPLLNGLAPGRLAARTLEFFGAASRRLREDSGARSRSIAKSTSQRRR